jgi:hypothetical protein
MDAEGYAQVSPLAGGIAVKRQTFVHPCIELLKGGDRWQKHKLSQQFAFYGTKKTQQWYLGGSLCVRKCLI